MNVAIMGAGISGLSCAITLEKHGIKPTIFEKRNCVGDRFVNSEAMFSILNRPTKDSLKYFKDAYEIDLTPIDTLKKLVFHSKNEVGTIDGKFDTSVAHVWFNYSIIPKGYAWLIPYSEKEANLVIAYPDYPNNIKLDINHIWKRFYDTACKDLDQNFKISYSFEITRYMLGICNKPIIDNTYFIGNCFGTISPGLGFGQFTSVLTGVYSALDLCKLEKYEKLSKSLFENYNNSLILRRFLENLTDDKIDTIIKSLDNKLLDNIINKVASEHNDLELLKYVTLIIKLN